MFDLGIQELIVIFVVALIVFGPKKLPELARSLGKGIGDLKRAMHGVKEQIDSEVGDVTKPIKDNMMDSSELTRIIEESIEGKPTVPAKKESGEGDQKTWNDLVKDKREKEESDDDKTPESSSPENSAETKGETTGSQEDAGEEESVQKDRSKVESTRSPDTRSSE